MMINISPEEVGYIGALAIYFRNDLLNKDNSEVLENLQIIEYAGVGQCLLLKLQAALIEDGNGEVGYS